MNAHSLSRKPPSTSLRLLFPLTFSVSASLSILPLLCVQHRMNIEAIAARAAQRNLVIAERTARAKERLREMEEAQRDSDLAAQRRLRFETTRFEAAAAQNIASHMNHTRELRRASSARKIRPSSARGSKGRSDLPAGLPTWRTSRPTQRRIWKPPDTTMRGDHSSHRSCDLDEVNFLEMCRLDFYREMRRSWDLELHRPPPVRVPSDIE